MKFLFFLVLSGCFFLLPGYLTLDSSAELSDIESLKKQVEHQKTRIKDINRNIRSKEEKIAEIGVEKVSVLKQLHNLDKKLAEQWIILENTRKKWSKVELDLTEIRKKIKELKDDNKEMRITVEKRLRVLREMGTVGVLNVLFASESFPEMMSREANLRLILSHDRNIRSQYYLRLKNMEKVETELTEKSEELSNLSSSIDQERRRLESVKKDRNQFLETLKTEGDRYTSMVDELKDAERSLQSIVVNLSNEMKKAEDAKAEAQELEAAAVMYDKSLGEKGFAALRGRLITPAPGNVIIPSLGRENNNYAGIVFGCKWGSRVKSIYDGTVIFKKNMPGYGNMVIIDHGERYFTLTSQAVQFFKDVGDNVFEGETIGLSGSGPWINEGIYFEIRHGERQKNPLRWLDLRGVKVLKSR